MKIREKRGDMSDARKMTERERARQRHRADGGAQARRRYLRALKKIAKPRPNIFSQKMAMMYAAELPGTPTEPGYFLRNNRKYGIG